MTARPPFLIVPWEHDFLAALANILISEYAPRLDEVTIIFPHTRPARYLRRILAGRNDLAKPCLLPAMHALPEIVSNLAAHLEPDHAIPRQNAHILDQAALLREAARAVAQNEPPGSYPAGRFTQEQSSPTPSASSESAAGPEEGKVKEIAPLEFSSPNFLAELTSDARRWLPWGLRLASLMEELFTAGITPGNFHYLEGSVPPFAAVLLERLTAIHAAYAAELNARALTTAGYDAKLVLDALRHAPRWDEGGSADALLPGLAGRRIILAGFHGLTGVEELLFRRLWENYGARILFHSDVRVVSAPNEAHWACAAHAAWIKRWNAPAQIAEGGNKSSAAYDPATNADNTGKGKFAFYQGYDLHSQLTRLPELLPVAPTESTAIVLLNSSLLMPLLHHLPRKDVNISMGYPLERTALARLAENIFKLQESRNPAPVNSGQAATYHWRAILNLIRHPYLRMLECDGKRPLQKLLARLEKIVRSGAPFIDPHALARTLTEETDAVMPEEAQNAALLTRVLNLTITDWENMHTLQGAAQNLAGLAELLMTEGRDLWPRFPLDGEYLFRLAARLIPQLEQSVFAPEPLDTPTLLAVLRESLRNEHVPFEADPLEGAQILGMLETRLLSFERVLILDATDDNLPGSPIADPLLPDSLRRELGLPGLAERELSMAYTFNRLIHSSAKVDILYQTGLGGGNLLDEKKIRSRFVEELVWEEEQRQKRLLSPGNAPLYNISFNITPAGSAERSIPKTEETARAIEAWLKKPVSPTSLDAYLRCPVNFCYSRLAGFATLDAVREGDDPAGTGEFLHAVLQNFFTPYLDAAIPAEFPTPDDEKRLAGIYLHTLKNTDLPSALPYASLLMLEHTGLARLVNMLRQTPPGAHILALESTLDAPLSVAGREITLRGKLDRVDFRNTPDGSEEAVHTTTKDHPARGNEAIKEGHILILDYKSGVIRESKKSGFWTKDNPLWRNMAEWTSETPPASKAYSALQTLAADLKSLQLPIYLYLHQHHQPSLVRNAAFVDLARSGTEKPLFSAAHCRSTGFEGNADALRSLYEDFIPALPAFVLRHLIECEEFAPHPGESCTWCPYTGLCRKRNG